MTEVVSALLDPVAEIGPGGEQRLVSDFDGGRAGEGIGVERQEAVAAELSDHLLHGDDVDVERHDLGCFDPSTASVVIRGDGDKTKEELTCGGLLVWVQLPIEVGCPSAQSALNAAHRTVGRRHDRVAGPAIEEFGQRVLEQRQGTGLVADIGDQQAQQ